VITLSPEQTSSILAEAKAELVAHLITQHKDDLSFLSPAQAGGYLDVTQNTLMDLKIPRSRIGTKIRYQLSDLKKYLESTKEGA